jgi:hypothetical protein
LAAQTQTGDPSLRKIATEDDSARTGRTAVLAVPAEPAVPA